MDMLWRGIDYIVDQLVDYTVDQQNIKIDNNNTINTVLPAEMLQRIFRLIWNISGFEMSIQIVCLDQKTAFRPGFSLLKT